MPHVYAIVRIPKSGSSSLESSIGEALAPKHLFKVPMLANPDAKVSRLEALRTRKKKLRRIWKNFGVFSEQSMWSKIHRQMEDGDIISGHFAYGAPDIGDTEVKYITIVREPLARFVSEYKWVRHGYTKRWGLKGLYHFGRPAASAKSMDYYLDFLVEHYDAYSNPATRYICGDSTASDPAQHLLREYWHFGLLERAGTFAQGFERKTGLPFKLHHINYSPSQSKIQLSKPQLAKFEQLHDRDLALYQELQTMIDDGALA